MEPGCAATGGYVPAVRPGYGDDERELVPRLRPAEGGYADRPRGRHAVPIIAVPEARTRPVEILACHSALAVDAEALVVPSESIGQDNPAARAPLACGGTVEGGCRGPPSPAYPTRRCGVRPIATACAG